jgi:hypothetical protein
MKGVLSMKWIKVAIGAVVAISVIPMIVSTVTDLTKPAVDPTPAGPLYGTLAGTLIDLSPVIFVAGVLTFLFLKTGQKSQE